MAIKKKTSNRNPPAGKNSLDFYEVDWDNDNIIIDDITLAFNLGIRAKTLWFLIHTKNSQYTTFSIKKRGKAGKKGKVRNIQNPHTIMKNVQRAMLYRVFSKIKFGPEVGAYVPGRCCSDTADQHVNNGTLISLDIFNFFPSIKRSKVRASLKNRGYTHYVAGLIADLVTYENFVPQGSPTSGAVSNMVGADLIDKPIMDLLEKDDARWVYTRYSDDICVSHPDELPRERVDKIIVGIAEAMKKNGFKPNREKTRVDRKYRQQKVLGIVVNEKRSIPRKEYRRIDAIIHNSIQSGFHTQYEKAGMNSTGELIEHLKGKLSYFEQIDPYKTELLREKLDFAILTFEELSPKTPTENTGRWKLFNNAAVTDSVIDTDGPVVNTMGSEEKASSEPS